eukprot:Rhum_TRINITY_DN19139_c0_g1::Rhum_TRINITY_DN19139_c0_g1_i1::g.169262::m.169262
MCFLRRVVASLHEEVPHLRHTQRPAQLGQRLVQRRLCRRRRREPVCKRRRLHVSAPVADADGNTAHAAHVLAGEGLGRCLHPARLAFGEVSVVQVLHRAALQQVHGLLQPQVLADVADAHHVHRPQERPEDAAAFVLRLPVQHVGPRPAPPPLAPLRAGEDDARQRLDELDVEVVRRRDVQRRRKPLQLAHCDPERLLSVHLCRRHRRRSTRHVVDAGVRPVAGRHLVDFRRAQLHHNLLLPVLHQARLQHDVRHKPHELPPRLRVCPPPQLRQQSVRRAQPHRVLRVLLARVAEGLLRRGAGTLHHQVEVVRARQVRSGPVARQGLGHRAVVRVGDEEGGVLGRRTPLLLILHRCHARRAPR